MRITVRDLTQNVDFNISLPTESENLRKSLREGHEYIIIDHDGILRPGELSDINELNDFLIYCKENDIDDNTLRILSVTYLYEEVLECVKRDSYTIVDFTSETAEWFCGVGGDYSDNEHLGLCLFSAGYGNLPFPYTEEMEDYIKWEYVWTDAQCTGWRRVIVENKCYLVKWWC